MATTDQITTAEQLLEAHGLGRCELLRGELVMMSPAGSEHGVVVVRVTGPLNAFVRQHSLGEVLGAETGFKIGHRPDTVRAPDVAFVSRDRWPPQAPKGFFPGAPDLAVEVISPGDRASEVLAKVEDWLDAGCRAVWVVDPETRTVAVYHGRTAVEVLRVGDHLDGGELLPDFRLAVAEIFV
ncbi:MAG: Uma2 family endonuclease [Thermoguttaceae bacterium]